jgi:hypothetical protein
MVTVACSLAAVFAVGCSTTYDCDESCELMRSCGHLFGTALETCEVACVENEDDREDAIDECGECLDSNDCSQSCINDCVCALSLSTAEYTTVSCVR